jgi:phosphosulfolactate synthase (CoM biosynthesis protein A)
MSYLRNSGIITEKEYVGKTFEEAKKYAEEGGFEVRVVEQNGIALMLDMSTKSNRINFRVREGYITGAFGG